MKRERVPYVISRLIDGRPVRWAPANRSVGDYDGRERTLQVFNADPKDQRRLLDVIDSNRAPLEEAVGGPLIVIFHSVRQSAERYADFVKSFPRPISTLTRRPPAPEKCVDMANENGTHRREAA
jgi:hypothetical protein